MPSHAATFKLPFPLHRAVVAQIFAFAQTARSYQQSGIYQLQNFEVSNGEISSRATIDLSRFPNKLVQKLLPRGAEHVEEKSKMVFPTCNTQYQTAFGTCTIRTEFSTSNSFGDKLEDLSREGEPSCFLNKRIDLEISCFGKSLLEPIVLRVASRLFARMARQMVSSMPLWAELGEEDLLDIMRMDMGSVQEIEE